MLVREVFDSARMDSLIIDENEDLEKAIARFAEHPQLRGIFLVDGRMELKGVVTRADLLNMAKLKLGKDLNKIPPRMLLLKTIRDAKIKDIASTFSRRACVREDIPWKKL